MLSADPAPSSPSAWPEKPVPAILPRTEACSPPYREQRNVCVHAAYAERTSQAGLDSQIDQYLRGAVAPRIGGRPTPEAVPSQASRTPTSLPPGALSASTLPSAADAEQARQRRLKALDAMLALARAEIARNRRPARAAAQAAAPREDPSLPPGSEASLQQLTGAIRELQPGQAALMLEQMERRGFRQELGEDVWRQIQAAPRSDGF